MKTKFILPLTAVILATASAFTTRPLYQVAWFKDHAGMVASAEIDNVDTNVRPCHINGFIQCRIREFNAYIHPEAAMNAPATFGLLKYNP